MEPELSHYVRMDCGQLQGGLKLGCGARRRRRRRRGEIGGGGGGGGRRRRSRGGWHPGE